MVIVQRESHGFLKSRAVLTPELRSFGSLRASQDDKFPFGANEDGLGGGGFAEADEFAEFGVVVQAV